MKLYEIDRVEGINHLTSLVIPPVDYRFSPSDFGSLTQIVAELRSEHGCPWDKKQTHESLIPYLIEESYEAIEAIKENDADNLREELGDVLLQVMLHAQIAAEENTLRLKT
jgi:tetrapyrrole methylase family protein/MazG family protein